MFRRRSSLARGLAKRDPLQALMELLQDMKKESCYLNVGQFTDVVFEDSSPAYDVYSARCTLTAGLVALKCYRWASIGSIPESPLAEILHVKKCAKKFGVLGQLGLLEESKDVVLVSHPLGVCRMGQAIAARGPFTDEGFVVERIVKPLATTLAQMHADGIVHCNVVPQNVAYKPCEHCILMNLECSVCSDPACLCSTFPPFQVTTAAVTYTPPELARVMLASLRERPATRGSYTMSRLRRVMTKAFSRTRTASRGAGPGAATSSLRSRVTPAVDVWQLGCLVYELLVGTTPIDMNEDFFAELMDDGGQARGQKRRKSGSLSDRHAEVLPFDPESTLMFGSISYPATLSPLAVDCIKRCLVLEPGDRATMTELLRHPWMATKEQVDESEDMILAVAEMLSGLTAPVAGTTEAVSADVSGTAQGDTAEVPQERKTTGEMLRKGRRPSVELLAREVRSHNADDAGARQAVGAVAAVLETEVAPPVNTQGPLAKLARDHARRTSLRSAQFLSSLEDSKAPPLSPGMRVSLARGPAGGARPSVQLPRPSVQLPRVSVNDRGSALESQTSVSALGSLLRTTSKRAMRVEQMKGRMNFKNRIDEVLERALQVPSSTTSASSEGPGSPRRRALMLSKGPAVAASRPRSSLVPDTPRVPSAFGPAPAPTPTTSTAPMPALVKRADGSGDGDARQEGATVEMYSGDANDSLPVAAVAAAAKDAAHVPALAWGPTAAAVAGGDPPSAVGSNPAVAAGTEGDARALGGLGVTKAATGAGVSASQGGAPSLVAGDGAPQSDTPALAGQNGSRADDADLVVALGPEDVQRGSIDVPRGARAVQDASAQLPYAARQEAPHGAPQMAQVAHRKSVEVLPEVKRSGMASVRVLRTPKKDTPTTDDGVLPTDSARGVRASTEGRSLATLARDSAGKASNRRVGSVQPQRESGTERAATDSMRGVRFSTDYGAPAQRQPSTSAGAGAGLFDLQRNLLSPARKSGLESRKSALESRKSGLESRKSGMGSTEGSDRDAKAKGLSGIIGAIFRRGSASAAVVPMRSGLSVTQSAHGNTVTPAKGSRSRRPSEASAMSEREGGASPALFRPGTAGSRNRAGPSRKAHFAGAGDDGDSGARADGQGKPSVPASKSFHELAVEMETRKSRPNLGHVSAAVSRVDVMNKLVHEGYSAPKSTQAGRRDRAQSLVMGGTRLPRRPMDSELVLTGPTLPLGAELLLSQ